jgi:hypothetical protein
MIEFLVDGEEGVREGERELCQVSVDWQERIDHAVRREDVFQFTSPSGCRFL